MSGSPDSSYSSGGGGGLSPVLCAGGGLADDLFAAGRQQHQMQHRLQPAAGFGAAPNGAGAPTGAGAGARTTRVFIARIPAAVGEAQFRAYFEKYGRLQDAYMPRDHTRQAYRGIGFVTFADADSVERVLATKHW
jgi:hypothetical protein